MPDLVPLSVVSDNSIALGEATTVVVNFQNVGDGDADAGWVGYLYVSVDSVISGIDTKIGEFVQGFMLPSQASGQAFVIATVPHAVPSGTYYLGVILDADDDILESIETNNSGMGEDTVVVYRPAGKDLFAYSVSGPNSAFNGERFEVSLGMASIGAETVSDWMVDVYLSPDTNITAADTRIGQLRRIGSRDVTVPATISPGSYYLGMIIDPADSIPEVNELNNRAFSEMLIEISAFPQPDLVIDSLLADTSFGLFNATLVTYRNLGSAAASGSWVGRLYASSDTAFGGDDVVMWEFTETRSLGIGQGGLASMGERFILDPGSYHFAVVLDATGVVEEASEVNNVRRYPGDPIEFEPSDLVPVRLFPPMGSGGLSSRPDTTLVTFYNVGGGWARGGWSVELYLSNDTIFDESDLAVGEAEDVLDLPPRELTSGGLGLAVHTTVPDNTRPDVYYWIAVVDPTDLVHEADENNNILHSFPWTWELEPIMLSLNPTSRSGRVSFGKTDTTDVRSQVVLDGWKSGNVEWQAEHRAVANWIRMKNASGTGSGWVRWIRIPNRLSPGLHVDTILVTAIGTGLAAAIVDSLEVLAPLEIAVNPTSRFASAFQGTTESMADSALVTMSGEGSSTATWSATHSSHASWVTLSDAAGSGDGWVRWIRDPTNLTPGLYIDTISLVAPGAVGTPATLVDTLEIIVTEPLVLTVAPSSRYDVWLINGIEWFSDSASINLSGTWAHSTNWSVTHAQSASWLSIDNPRGSGSGVVRWHRDTTALEPGVYVDTLTVTVPDAQGSPAIVIDSLEVPLILLVDPSSHRDSVLAGDTAVQNVAATVTLEGPTSTRTEWVATHRQTAGFALTDSTGIGSGMVRWVRDPSNLAAGFHIDTIVVTAHKADGSPALVIDTLTVVPVPLRLVLDPRSRTSSAIAGSIELQRDSTDVLISGTGSGTTEWSSAHSVSASWNQLTTDEGVGPGRLSWNRDPSGLLPGFYLDTIWVSAGVLTDSIIDRLEVQEPSIELRNAAMDLLAGATLTDRKRRFLDMVGNQDGTYNIGDFLAYLDRVNNPSPVPMERTQNRSTTNSATPSNRPALQP